MNLGLSTLSKVCTIIQKLMRSMCGVEYCSTLMLVTIHLYFYAFNVYAWQRTRINYPFIFGFSPGTELRYREVLLLSTGFTTFLLGGMNIHIAVTLLTHPAPAPPGVVASPTASQGSTVTDVIPMILVLVRTCILTLCTAHPALACASN